MVAVAVPFFPFPLPLPALMFKAKGEERYTGVCQTEITEVVTGVNYVYHTVGSDNRDYGCSRGRGRGRDRVCEG